MPKIVDDLKELIASKKEPIALDHLRNVIVHLQVGGPSEYIVFIIRDDEVVDGRYVNTTNSTSHGGSGVDEINLEPDELEKLAKIYDVLGDN